MEIREYIGYNEPQILELYSSVGWSAYTDHPDVLRKGFEKSLLTLAAYEGDALLGLIRLVGDGETVIFIQDLLVYPEHQRRGVGTSLVKAVLNRFSHVRQIELVSDDTEKTKAFYRSCGFLPMKEIGCCGFMKI